MIIYWSYYCTIAGIPAIPILNSSASTPRTITATTLKTFDCLKTCETAAPHTCAKWYDTFFTVGGCGLSCPPRIKRKTQPKESCEFRVQVGDRVLVKSSSLEGCVKKVEDKKGKAVVLVRDKGLSSRKEYSTGEILLVRASDATCTSLPQQSNTTTTTAAPKSTTAVTTKNSTTIAIMMPTPLPTTLITVTSAATLLTSTCLLYTSPSPRD